MLQTVRHRAHQATTTVVDKDVADWLTAGPDYESVGHPFAAPEVAATDEPAEPTPPKSRR